MTDKDVEMKDAKDDKKAEGEKKVEEVVEPEDPFFDFKRVLVLLEKGAKDKDYKLCAALTKKFKKLRKDLTIHDVMLLFEYFLPELHKRVAFKHTSTQCENKEEKLHVKEDRVAALMSLPET